MAGNSRSALAAVTAASVLWWGCSAFDEDYKAGVHWLTVENNPQQAVRCFQRSLDKNPRRWQTHRYLLEALSRAGTPDEMEAQLRQTLSLFPDSARSPAVSVPGIAALGEERFSKLSGSLELHHVGALLAKKGDDPALLERAIIAACAARDTVAVNDYLRRHLARTGGKPPSDLALQEMTFFLGSARLKWMLLDRRIEANPKDWQARLEQLDLGVLAGDSAGVASRLRELAKLNPDLLTSEFAVRYGTLVGLKPFVETQVGKGWEAHAAKAGGSVVFVKDLGKTGQPDRYLYRAAASGEGETPLLKAAQQYLAALAVPVWSPDGAWIYFYGSPDRNWTPSHPGRFFLFRVKPTYGAAPRKIYSESDLLPGPPHFNPDGTLLLVRRDVGSTRASVEILRLNPESGATEVLSRIGEPVSGAAFTPAGDSLIFLTDRGIFRRAVTGGNISVDYSYVGFQNPQVSPDGKTLLLFTANHRALLLDRTTGHPTDLGSVAIPRGSFIGSNEVLLTRSDGGALVVCRIRLTPPTDPELAADLKEKLQ